VFRSCRKEDNTDIQGRDRLQIRPICNIKDDGAVPIGFVNPMEKTTAMIKISGLRTKENNTKNKTCK